MQAPVRAPAAPIPAAHGGRDGGRAASWSWWPCSSGPSARCCRSRRFATERAMATETRRPLSEGATVQPAPPEPPVTDEGPSRPPVVHHADCTLVVHRDDRALDGVHDHHPARRPTPGSGWPRTPATSTSSGSPCRPCRPRRCSSAPPTTPGCGASGTSSSSRTRTRRCAGPRGRRAARARRGHAGCAQLARTGWATPPATSSTWLRPTPRWPRSTSCTRRRAGWSVETAGGRRRPRRAADLRARPAGAPGHPGRTRRSRPR